MEQFLTAARVARTLAIAASELESFLLEHNGPKPIQLGNRGLRWRRSEIELWIEQLIDHPRPVIRQPESVAETAPPVQSAEPLPAAATTSALPARELLPTLAQEILQVLQEANDWLHAAEIAYRISSDVSCSAGNWNRMIRRLKTEHWIISHPKLGYRIRSRS
ncbi:helix-turn-helix transcriptional regulator [Tuwongella immobilis]|uniref:: Phage_AlpA n=1 Tax=Tuwongella immobilis TaxID=692036 RepID=A0A6C2YRH8_9BACT|nr:AlpA family phage regulatory protein [Tuwongella immobilis]VIP03934.1 : Phage_AlpA [Tuwongella immobilis]VTS05235.1 : Phage_AlpA [Tuwongella immobilis]